MKKILKIGAGLALLAILAGVYIWFFVYNKPHRDYEKADADFIISAEDCYNHYASGNSQSQLYLDNVLQIDGIPSSIESTDSTMIVVFAFSSGMFGDEGIRCTMLQNQFGKIKNLTLSENISIKGYCTGYNGTDVILEHCSLVTN